MNRASNKYSSILNLLLMFIAAFTVALTFYSCSKFYTYLPTSDTWIYTDFLAQAMQGHLDVATLFERHIGVHVIALPKLVYFFDMWLTGGSGALVTGVSLIAMSATTIIFVAVIFRNTAIDKQEKIFISLITTIFLMSACQAESLMNPANLQWSLLVFTATLSAWFFYRYTLKKSVLNLMGLFTGITLVSLTSASPLLIIIPLVLFVLRKKITKRVALIVMILLLATIGIVGIIFSEYIRFIPALLANWLKFTIDFLAPPIERLDSMWATVVTGMLLLAALFKLASTKLQFEEKETDFFSLLWLFSLFVIFATGVARAYSPTGFTFRFVNIGVLFNATLFPLLYLNMKSQRAQRIAAGTILFIYIGVLTYVNVTEVSTFGYGRNHWKLTQVAHALDINDPFVVSAMPGTIWEKQDFDYVQANKHKLQEVGAGIYGSKEYKNVGKPIKELGNLTDTSCKTTIIKMRRLLPDQAGYRLLGETLSDQGVVFSRAYFVDDKNMIRGFAIPMEPGKNILKNLWLNEQWGGFVNLDSSAEQQSLTLYAYSDSQICQGEKIELPDYLDLKRQDLRKKSEATEQ